MENNMKPDKQFLIKNPIDDIIETLKKNFFDDNETKEFLEHYSAVINKEEVIKFCAYALIQIETDNEKKSEEARDYFKYLSECKEKNLYEAQQIGKTNYVIVYTELKRSALLAGLGFLIDFFPKLIVEGKPDYLAIPREFISVICRSIKKIKSPRQKCIFYAIVDLRKDTFRMDEIAPYIVALENGTNCHKCNHIELDCKRRTQDDNCQITDSEIELELEALCKNGILEKIGTLWKVVE